MTFPYYKEQCHENPQSRLYATRSQRLPKKINNSYKTQVTTLRGRSYKNLDGTLDGIWWILCTGSQWNQLPEKYGKFDSIGRCFRRWCQAGLWPWVLAQLEADRPDLRIALCIDASHAKAHQDATRSSLTAEEQALGKTKGGRNSKVHAIVNLAGLLVNCFIRPGNEHEMKTAQDLLPQEISNTFLLADKGYDADGFRKEIKKRGGYPQIPPKDNRTQLIAYDKTIGKHRHVVENFFARIKRYRRVNTRYERVAEYYRGFVLLAAIRDWTRSQFVRTA